MQYLGYDNSIKLTDEVMNALEIERHSFIDFIIDESGVRIVQVPPPVFNIVIFEDE